MANVKGKEVSDGSHNVIYKAAEAGDVVNVVVEQVVVDENVKYKVAGVGDIPNAVASGVGGTACYLSDPWDDTEIWDDTCFWVDDGAELVTDGGVPVYNNGDIVTYGGA